MASELEWAEDKQRFLDDDAEQRRADERGDVPSRGPRHAGAPSGALASEFTQLARTLFEAATVEDVLERVTTTAQHVIPGADLTSITLAVPSGGYTTPVETDPVATRLDKLQYDSHEGPCVEATSIGRGLAFSSDLAAEHQWGSR